MLFRYDRSRFKKPNDSFSGFTVIELVIAILVLSIAGGGILSAVKTSKQMKQRNEKKALARNVAEQTFSEIRKMSNLVEAYKLYGGGGPKESFNIQGLQNPSANEPAGRVIIWRNITSLRKNVNLPQPDPGSSLPLSQEEVLEAKESIDNSFLFTGDSVANASKTNWDDYIDTNKDGVVDSRDDPQLVAVTLRIRWKPHSKVITQYYSAVIAPR